MPVLARVQVVMAWLAVALVGAALAVASATRPADASRPTASGTACSDPTGITVIVDFHELGGGVQVGCAAQPVDDGFEALTKAGFQVTNVTRFPGALCRIDGKPATDCTNMPSPNAYWSYWIAARGGSWCYSNLGASRKPPPGTVEGWSFAKDKGTTATPKPGQAPPSPIPGTTPNTIGKASCPSEPTTTTTKAPTTTRATTAPTTPATSGGTGGGTGTTTPPRSRTGSPTTAATGTDDGSSTSATEASRSTTSSTARDAERDDERDDERAAGTLTVRDREDDAGSAVGVALGGTAVLALGGVAVLTARRRRAHAEDLEG